MAQGVGRYGLLDPGAVDVAAKNLPGTHAAQGFAPRIEKENSLSALAIRFETGAQLADVGRDGGDGRTPDGHEPLLAAFAEDPHELVLEQQILRAERDPFRD